MCTASAAPRARAPAAIAISFCAPDERAYLRDIEKLTKQAVPVMAHALGTKPPAADDRPSRPRQPGRPQQRPQQRKHAPKKHHASDAHGHAHAKQGHAPTRGRDTGDRRDRKGHDVWSNGPPPRRQQKRKPTRV